MYRKFYFILFRFQIWCLPFLKNGGVQKNNSKKITIEGVNMGNGGIRPESEKNIYLNAAEIR